MLSEMDGTKRRNCNICIKLNGKSLYINRQKNNENINVKKPIMLDNIIL